MRTLLLLLIFTGTFSMSLQAQDLGLSFSYFIPRNGSFSAPISPFSIRGIGVEIHKNIVIQGGFSLYRTAGLNIVDMPLESNESLTGPNFSIFIPAELVFRLRFSRFQFDLKGGGFFFYGFDQNLNYGNLNEAIRIYENWDVAASRFSFKNYPGIGYHFGGEISYEVTGSFGILLGCNYLIGQSKFPLQGYYSGGTLQGGNTMVEARFDDAKIDFSGFEVSLGIFFSGRQRPSK